MLEPWRGRVYDPCCGSSGMFVQSIEFIRAHAWRFPPRGTAGVPGRRGNGRGTDLFHANGNGGGRARADIYVGAEPREDDGEPFEAKMTRLVAELRAQQAEGARLDAAIAENLERPGFGRRDDAEGETPS